MIEFKGQTTITIFLSALTGKISGRVERQQHLGLSVNIQTKRRKATTI